MVGAAKRRADRETAECAQSEPSVSSESTQRTLQDISGLDGARDPVYVRRVPEEYSKITDLKNISEALGIGGWYVARGIAPPDTIPQRPATFNKQGREASVTLNTFNVLVKPSRAVHQYDIAWGGDTDSSKRALVKKIWNSKTVKKALGEPANLWIYDGNKLAWATVELPRAETRIVVDLDAEEDAELVAQGKPPRKRQPRRRCEDGTIIDNKHHVFVRHTRKVDFDQLQHFLDGNARWNSDCIDTINFMDHLIREGPSKKYTQIKKSFFKRGEDRYDLGGALEAFKGVFASLRPVLNDRYQKSLSLNVDVANGTFWRAQPLLRAFAQLFTCTIPQFTARWKEARKGDWKRSVLRLDLKRFRRLGVVTMHLKGEQMKYTIEEMMDKTAYEQYIDDPDDDSQMISVAMYFYRKYGKTPQDHFPLAKMTKKIRGEPIYIPADFLIIDENQRYNYKLSDIQTSAMIKFAVTLPTARWQAVQHGVGMLDWGKDEYLRHYGLVISNTPAKVKARILPTPEIHFAPPSNSKVLEKDRVMGRWRLDGRKFININKNNPIKAWGVCVISGRGMPPIDHVKKFLENFIRIYEAHGGKVVRHAKFGQTPWMGPGNLSEGGELVANAYNATGNRYQAKPNFMIFIVNDRNVETYRRIKKSCDARFGVASQVLQSKHVIANQPQYISNVLMKVNAKLGGSTCVTKSVVLPKLNPKEVNNPISTMIIGADVSHPAPGAGSEDAASFAAITVSCDKNFARYWADVQTNGHRTEMITTFNIDKHFGGMAKIWMQQVGEGHPPKRVLYIRDGVSEGQYAAVIEEEVRDFKKTWLRLQGLQNKEPPKFTVIIAGKRHHIRFFPDQGDRNKNPLPGTLVETGCTHPHEFDFYLCSHVAIKGTARPIHYQCILNESDWPAEELQSFIFEHSFQYVRSTTPVSLHPAVYYAHLAADRCRAHTRPSPVTSKEERAKKRQEKERQEEIDKLPLWQRVMEEGSTKSSEKTVQVASLVELHPGVRETMWFI